MPFVGGENADTAGEIKFGISPFGYVSPKNRIRKGGRKVGKIKGFFDGISYKYNRIKMRHNMRRQHRKEQQKQKSDKIGTVTKIKEICGNIVDIKPKKEADYCLVLGLRMGRKLIMWILLAAAVVSMGCILLLMPESGMADGVRTYRYNALPLKFTSGQVRIMAKSGYVAYEGEVSQGAVNGKGTLYRKDGSLVYEGEFQNNKYQGEGKCYYKGNQLQYEGQLVNNQFQGQGILYSQAGTREYEGAFSFGQKQGQGKLYDAGGKLVYTGNFAKDRINYQELLGKSMTEMAQMYTGSRVVYENDSEYCVSMEDIDSIYISQGAVNTLEQEGYVQGVYVLSPSIVLEGTEYKTIKELKKKFKLISYEGNTSLTMADAVAVNVASKKTEVLNGAVTMDTTAVFEDVITVNSVDKSYQAYIYQLEDENILYTFFSKEKGKGFDFYLMEQK